MPTITTPDARVWGETICEALLRTEANEDGTLHAYEHVVSSFELVAEHAGSIRDEAAKIDPSSRMGFYWPCEMLRKRVAAVGNAVLELVLLRQDSRTALLESVRHRSLDYFKL